MVMMIMMMIIIIIIKNKNIDDDGDGDDDDDNDDVIFGPCQGTLQTNSSELTNIHNDFAVLTVDNTCELPCIS